MILAVLGVAATLASPAATVRPYASGFDPLTYVTSTPSEPNRLYAVEQTGRIRYLVRGKVSGTFLDIRSRVDYGGERGLLSMAFSPKYKTDHRFYVNYTDRNGDTRVVQFRSRNGKAIVSSARQILFVKQPYPNHNGGQLQFGPDGRLYVGMGDGGSAGDPGNRAQNLKIRLGKLLRTNPFARRPAWATVGYGLRNPWRFSFDSANGDLYIGDVGQGSWEEIDYLPRPRVGPLTNFGWNLYEGRARYRTGSPNTRGTLAFPVHVYGHDQGCSVTGGYVYRGSAVPSAVGRYFFADYCSGTVWSLRMNGGRAADVRTEGHVTSPASFGLDTSGELYVASGNGQIYRLTG